MSDEVRVDPAVLSRAASACEALGGDLGREEQDVEPATTAAMASLGGWYTRGALERLVWWWRDNLNSLGKSSGRQRRRASGMRLPLPDVWSRQRRGT